MRSTKFRRWIGVLPALALVGALIGCSDPGNVPSGEGEGEGEAGNDGCPEVDTIADGELTVSAVTFPPVYDTVDGAPGGIEGDLIQEIADLLCLELHVDVLSGEGVIPAVQAGRADAAVGGWARTVDRSEAMNLSDPLYEDGISILSTSGTGNLDDLEGTVGTPTGNAFIPDVEKVLGDDLRLYPGFPDLYSDLGTGRIDQAIVLTNQANVQLQKDPIEGLVLKSMEPDERVSMSMEPTQVAIPISKDNATLTEAINAAIEQLRAEGVIQEVLEKYGFPGEAAEVGEPTLLG